MINALTLGRHRGTSEQNFYRVVRETSVKAGRLSPDKKAVRAVQGYEGRYPGRVERPWGRTGLGVSEEQKKPVWPGGMSER